MSGTGRSPELTLRRLPQALRLWRVKPSMQPAASLIPGLINAHAHGCIRGPSMRAGSAPLKKSTVFRIGTDHLDGGVSGPVVDFVEHDALVEDVDEEFLSVRNEVVHLPRAMDNQPHRRRDPPCPTAADRSPCPNTAVRPISSNWRSREYRSPSGSLRLVDERTAGDRPRFLKAAELPSSASANSSWDYLDDAGKLALLPLRQGIRGSFSCSTDRAKTIPSTAGIHGVEIKKQQIDLK